MISSHKNISPQGLGAPRGRRILENKENFMEPEGRVFQGSEAQDVESRKLILLNFAFI